MAFTIVLKAVIADIREQPFLSRVSGDFFNVAVKRLKLTRCAS